MCASNPAYYEKNTFETKNIGFKIKHLDLCYNFQLIIFFVLVSHRYSDKTYLIYFFCFLSHLENLISIFFDKQQACQSLS